MKAVNGYYEKGQFIPSEAITFPRRVRAVLVFEDVEPSFDTQTPLTKHAQSWGKFLKEIRACNEPLGADFDTATNERVTFNREFRA